MTSTESENLAMDPLNVKTDIHQRLNMGNVNGSSNFTVQMWAHGDTELEGTLELFCI